LGGPILGRQMLEVTHHAVENLLNLTHTTYSVEKKKLVGVKDLPRY